MNYVRLARVAEATGQDELALASLEQAISRAKPSETIDGLALPELAKDQRFRLLMRLGEKAADDGEWATAASRFAAAAEATSLDRDELNAKLRLAEAQDRAGTPDRAVATLQGLLGMERLRRRNVAADPRRTVRADLLIAERLAKLLDLRGRELYAPYEEKARALLDQGLQESDPRLLEAVVRSYPVAQVVPEALLSLGRLEAREDRHAEAARAFRQLLALAPDDADRARALWGLGNAYEAQELWVPARDTYVKALSRYADMHLDDAGGTLGARVSERLSTDPFDRMTGDRSEPSLPAPLTRLWTTPLE